MENPLEVIGITRGTKIKDIVDEIETKVSNFNNDLKNMDELFNGMKGIKSTKFPENSIDSIVDDLSERFFLGLLSDVKGKNDFTHQEAFLSQYLRLYRKKREYEAIIDYFKENSNLKSAKESLLDLYIRLKYEEEVTKLARTIAEKNYLNLDSEEFKTQLLNDPQYIRLRNAYTKVKSSRDREENIPELFVKSRLAAPTLLVSFPTEFSNRILDRERTFKEQFFDGIAKKFRKKDKKIDSFSDNNNEKRLKKPRLKRRIFFKGAKKDFRNRREIKESIEEKFPINQYHEHSWGIILDNPTCVIKNESVKTPDFNGRVSVTHLGYFAAESLFRKKRYLNQNGQTNNTLESFSKGDKIFYLVDDGNNSSKSNYHSCSYYKNIPTKKMYNSIYYVEKTDESGKKREYIVFSPIGNDITELDKISKNFLLEIYFSNYVLDIAEQNGGFMGEIIETEDGYSISTVDSTDEIASSILFNSNSEGEVLDRTLNKKKWEEKSGEEVKSILRDRVKYLQRER